MAHEFLTDVETSRERARQHIENGAVTENYKADRETEGILAIEEEHADDLANLPTSLDPREKVQPRR